MAKTSAFMQAIDEICEEKGLKNEVVIEAVEAAIAAAYRKDYGKNKQIMRAKMDPLTGEADVFRVFEIVESEEEVEEAERQLTLVEARKLDKKAEIGGEITIPQPKEDDFGRIAAQTAKQVVIQRIREAEREMLFEEYKDKEGGVLSASVQQIDGKNIIVSLGKANAIIYPSDQIRSERYYIGQRVKVYIREVGENARGPQIVVSRTDEGLIRGLFESEVPEIASGSVEMKSIAREPGSRTKIAVIANEDGIDPVGSCVGQRGTRVQAILNEIGEEKIDIVLWDEDVEQFIMNALSPAKTTEINISSKEHKATVKVNKDNLSLAIGKGGQNVRLASKLTGWGIDIIEDEEAEVGQNTDPSEALNSPE
jgi:N utilization substance protein A